jgi:hypothetical protein
MAILVINDRDLSEKLKDFSLTCNNCGSKKVTLDIDWAAYPSASWMNVTLSCADCHKDEDIYST